MTRYHSEKRLRLARGEPCLVCGIPGSSAHHLTYMQPAAMSMKVGDQYTVPLCHKHHMELHAHGNEKQWWALQGVEPEEWLKSERLHTDSRQ